MLKEYKNKKVLITGHTGFKGSWLCTVLKMAGAKVIGYALNPSTKPSLFELAQIGEGMTSMEGDIRNFEKLNQVFKEHQPEYVFHLAAQPLVRESYENPVYTYETNVMGTVNLMECIRQNACVKSVVNVTTDKVYENKEWEWGYRENDILNGYDPYSNSKSCSELVTQSYKNSFFKEREVRVSTARAGNVIGGGDFSKDRIIPDCVSAALKGETLLIRNPYSIRPYQHVLEPLGAYLSIASGQMEDKKKEGCYNVGPEDKDCITTGELVHLFYKYWNEDIKWESRQDGGPHEANFLKLDCSKIKTVFGWQPKWNIEKAVEKTVAWTKIYAEDNKTAVNDCMEQQIREYFQ